MMEKPIVPYHEHPKQDSGVSIVVVLIMFLIAIAASLAGVHYVILPSAKEDNTSEIQSITKSVGKVADNVTGLQNIVNSLPASLTSQINTAIAQLTNSTNSQIASIQNQVSGIASKSQDSSGNSAQVNTSLANLSAQIGDLNAQLRADEGKIASQDARLRVLETGSANNNITPPNPASNANKISVTISTVGNNALYLVDNLNAAGQLAPDGVMDALQGQVRMTLNNNTNYDISNIILDVQFNIYQNMPNIASPTLTGGSVPWQVKYRDSQTIQFFNGSWGLNLSAGQSMNLTLQLLIQSVDGGVGNSNGYYYQIQCKAE